MSKLTKRGRRRRQINPLVVGRLFALLGVGVLASCSSLGGDIPAAIGGLPQGAPERSETPVAFPAVHDMPPPRTGKVLTEDEKKKVEAELTVMRAEQARRAQSSAAGPE
jgi:hypothetical protein